VTPKRCVPALVFLFVAACARGGPQDRGVQTSLTQGTVEANKPPPTRTTDATGFVDNGGRRSDEVARGGEMSGVRPTEQGSDLPTGTPASGTPIPIEPRTPNRPTAPERAAPEAPRPAAAGDADTEWGTRLARARCDRATFCDGIGPGKKYGTQDGCVAAERNRALDDIAALPCDVAGDRQNACLSEIHTAPCNVEPDLERGACSPAALCQ
jgi:hypothetical protein